MKRLCIYGHGYYTGRCAACQQVRSRRLAPTAQRGYGSAHQRARRFLAATLPASCGYCGVEIYSDEKWAAAHVVDGQPQHGYVVAHWSCNARAKVRRGAIGHGALTG